MRKFFFIFSIVLPVFIFSCSSNGTTPVSPSDSLVDEIAQFQSDTQNSNHNLLGVWTVDFDIENLTIAITPNRSLNQHYNVTSLIPAPLIQVNSWDPVTETINVDVAINNPYFVDVYDVRLIIYTDSAGHMLLNDDNWTPLYDISEGLAINPFKAFAKHIANRKFAGNSWQSENLQIECPNNNFTVQFAIDASYPGNCEEPYEISACTVEELFNRPGATADIEVSVYDWQRDVTRVRVYCPEIFSSVLLDLSQVSTERWCGTFSNSNNADVGSYLAYIVAESEGTGWICLYDEIIINIIDEHGWVQCWGGISPCLVSGPSVDGVGNINVTGSFRSTVDFDPGQTVNEYTAYGERDIYYSSFTERGGYKWTKTWGWYDEDHYYDEGYKTATDNQNNVYVLGEFSKTVDFDPGPDSDLHSSNGMNDVFLSKFDINGNYIWTCTWGGDDWDRGLDLVIDNENSISITGLFCSEVLDLDPGPLEDLHYLNGDSDIYLIKLDSNGNLIWAHTWGGGRDEGGVSIDITPFNNILLCGDFESENVDFDPGTGVDEHSPVHSYDIFVSKFTSSGDFLWCITLGGHGYDWDGHIQTSEAGNIFVSGDYKDTIDLDPGPGIYELKSKGDFDIFLVKLDNDANFVQACTWGGEEEERLIDLLMDSSDNVYVTGVFEGIVDFDPGSGVDLHDPGSAGDFFISNFTSEIDFQWVRCFGGERSAGSTGLAVDDRDNIYITGLYLDTIDFDPGPGIEEHTAVGDSDAFLLKLLPNGYWE